MLVRPARPTALVLALLAAVAAGGCGDDAAPAPAAGAASVASGTTASVAAPPPSPVVAPAPPKPRDVPAQPANGAPAGADPTTDAEYVAVLVGLSKDLDDEIDGARRSGDSTEIRRVVERITEVVDGWSGDGHAAGAGPTLVAAGQTAVSAVESPLLLDEAHRQVAAARAALGG